MSDDLRETLRAELEASRTDGGGRVDATAVDGGSAEQLAGTPQTQVAASVATHDQEAGGESNETAPPDAGGTADTRPTRQRGADGKFTKGEAAKTQAPKEGQTDSTQTPQAAKPTVTQAPVAPPVTTTETKPPASWRAMAREHWGKVPPEVRSEIVRREQEATDAMRDAGPAKEFHKGFQQTISPYMPLIQAEAGGDPMKAVQGLLNTAYQLRTDPVKTLAALIKHYNPNIDQLAAALDANPQTGPQNPQGQGFDPNKLRHELKQEIFQELNQQRGQAVSQRAGQEIASFSAGKEFFEDLRDDIGDMLSSAAQRGRALTLEGAYNKALLIHKADPDSEIGAVLRQREQAAQVANAQASTQSKLNAAVSVRSQPASSNGAMPTDSLRDTLRAELEASRRR